LWRSRHGLAIYRPKTSGTEDLPKSAIVSYIKAMDKDRKKIEELTGFPMATSSYAITCYKDENRSHYA